MGLATRIGARRAALVLFAALLVATLANGAFGYLARLGVLDQARFREYVQFHCGGPGSLAAPLAIACRCWPVKSGVDYSTAPSPAYLYHTEGYRLPLKFGKDLCVALLLLASLAWLPRIRRDAWRPIDAVAVSALPFTVCVGLLLSLLSFGPLFTVLATRSFQFLAVAALAAWLAPHLPALARALAWLMPVEASLVAVEMAYGLPIRSCPNSFRAAGTFVLPNSLGIAAALSLGFCSAFAPELLRRWWLWLATAWLVLASGSGAGIALLFVVAAAHASGRIAPERRRRWLASSAVAALALAAALPTITQRPEIYDSLVGEGGRVEKALQVLREETPTQRALGQGMGVGTNSAVNLSSAGDARVRAAYAHTESFYADSTITSFLMQFGVAGVAAWVLLLSWAWARDPQARAFYAATAFASLVVNVPELFPANILLGLALAHTLLRRGLVELRP